MVGAQAVSACNQACNEGCQSGGAEDLDGVGLNAGLNVLCALDHEIQVVFQRLVLLRQLVLVSLRLLGLFCCCGRLAILLLGEQAGTLSA